MSVYQCITDVRRKIRRHIEPGKKSTDTPIHRSGQGGYIGISVYRYIGTELFRRRDLRALCYIYIYIYIYILFYKILEIIYFNSK